MGAAVAAALSVNFQLPEFQVTTQNVYRPFFRATWKKLTHSGFCLLQKEIIKNCTREAPASFLKLLQH